MARGRDGSLRRDGVRGIRDEHLARVGRGFQAFQQGDLDTLRQLNDDETVWMRISATRPRILPLPQLSALTTLRSEAPDKPSAVGANDEIHPAAPGPVRVASTPGARSSFHPPAVEVDHARAAGPRCLGTCGS